MLQNMKNVLVGANRKIGIPGVIEPVIKIELRNKKKVKVDDGMDILERKGIWVREDKG